MAHKNKTNLSPYKSRNPSRPASAQKGQHRTPQKVFSAEEANDRLFDLFKNHGINFVSHEQRMMLSRFYVLLMENQKNENFTRLLTLKDVGIKHFVDSLMICQFTKLSFPLLDMGTGPGFPGIPLKIAFTKERILLAEGVQKRVEFLKQVRESLKLENLDIIGRNINQYFAYPVQGVITRAVEDITNTLTNVISALQVGGKVFLMKGPNVDPEIKQALAQMSEYYRLENDFHYEIPNSPHQRRLIVFEKIKSPPPIDFDEEPWPDED